jgi:WD40 repeat protein
MATGELLLAWQAHFKAAVCAAFSECGSLLVTGGADGLVHVWDIADLTEPQSSVHRPAATLSGHTMTVSALSFLPGSGLSGGPSAARLVTASADRSVRWWDLASLTCLLNVTLPVGLTSICLGSGGRVVYAGSVDGCVYAVGSAALSISEGESSKPFASFVGHTAAVSAVSVTASGDTLVSASDDGTVRVWDTLTASLLASWSVGDSSSSGGGGSASGASESSAIKRAAVTSMALISGRPVGLGAGARSAAASAQHLTVASLRKHKTHTPAGINGASISVLNERTTIAPLRVRIPDAAVARAADAALSTSWSVLTAIEALIAPTSNQSENEQELQKRIAALEDENARWKAIASKMLKK